MVPKEPAVDLPSNRKPDAIDILAGSRLRLQRNSMGLSQTALAEKVGVTFQQIQKYERGVNRISASRLQSIARELAVPVSFFLGDGQDFHAGDTTKDAELRVFLSSKDGRTLNRAFQNIHDPHIRQALIDLVEAAAYCGTEGS